MKNISALFLGAAVLVAVSCGARAKSTTATETHASVGAAEQIAGLPALEALCPVSNRSEWRFWLLDDAGVRYLLRIQGVIPHGRPIVDGELLVYSPEPQWHGVSVILDSRTLHFPAIAGFIEEWDEADVKYAQEGKSGDLMMIEETCRERAYSRRRNRDSDDARADTIIGFIKLTAEAKQ